MSAKIFYKVEPPSTIVTPIQWFRDHTTIKHAYNNLEIEDGELRNLIRKYIMIKIVSVVSIVAFILIAVINSYYNT